MTLFTDVYDKFLFSIKDKPMINELTIDELEDVLYEYLTKSVALEFKYCDKDLTDIDLEAKQFNETLSNEEIYIIVYGMILAWLSPLIKNESLLRKNLSDKDYHMYSPANHMKELSNFESHIKKQLRTYKLSYLYDAYKGLR